MAAYRFTRALPTRPTLVIFHSLIGYGSPNKEDTSAAHGSPLGEEEVKLTKENLGWPIEPRFYVPDKALAHFRQAVGRGWQAEEKWEALFALYAQAFPNLAEELQRVLRKDLPVDWDADIPHFPADDKGVKTRVASGKVMNAIARQLS